MPDTDDAKRRIAELREEIDAVDCELVRLLNRRATIALEIRSLKPSAQLGLYDPKREEEIFAHLASCNEGPLYGENLREIYEAILHVMKELRG
ncbi:MAG: chorismate mutase [Coriobacteriaceae bacterium]|nr:chorismate mutase [Coriobacteriaceae bacterium]